MPSAPCTTHARSDPSSSSARASSSVSSGRGTPTSCRVAPAGLVSGPSRLNAVRTPSSLRVGAGVPHRRMKRRREEERDAGLVEAALDDGRRRRDRRRRAPRSTSALPQRLDTDRLPCFATRTPHAATTSAAHDEMLNVPDRSPPVPHVSNTSVVRAATAAPRARASSARGRRSPRAARPSSPGRSAGRRSAPACARPFHDLVHRRRRLVGRQVLVARAASRCRSGNMVDPVYMPSRKLRRMRAALAGQDRLGMKLHAVHRPASRCRRPMIVPSSRVRAVTSSSVGQPVFGDDQRVVPRRRRTARRAREDARGRRARSSTSCRASARGARTTVPPNTAPIA